MGISGISSGFPGLSRSSGQVAHVLLTRSPLGLHQCCHRLDLVRLACVRHAASVRPEPGSNSPSRSPPRTRRLVTMIREPAPGLAFPGADRHDSDKSSSCTVVARFSRAAPKRARGCPHWLLALTVPFSRSDAARTRGCWCRNPRTVPRLGVAYSIRPLRPVNRACSHPARRAGCGDHHSS